MHRLDRLSTDSVWSFIQVARKVSFQKLKSGTILSPCALTSIRACGVPAPWVAQDCMCIFTEVRWVFIGADECVCVCGGWWGGSLEDASRAN